MAKNNIIQEQSIKYIMVGVNRVAKLHDGIANSMATVEKYSTCCLNTKSPA